MAENLKKLLSQINNLEINGDNAIIDVYKSIIHNANEPISGYFQEKTLICGQMKVF